MKIIDGKDSVLGRLASYVAKEALKGEDFVILNCKEIIISGNSKFTEEKFRERRSKVGSGQQGPKHSRLSHLIVKRAIRGMLPTHRHGRGKQTLKKIKCYAGVPKEFEEKEKIKLGKNFQGKYIKIGELKKQND